MRKLIVCNIMSLDGYFEGPGKNVMVMPMDEAFDAYNAERLRAAGTLLLGRTTYDGLRGFWPPLADDPNAASALRDDPKSRRSRGVVTPASSAARTLTSRLPNSNAKPATTSWSLAAAHSGTIC